MAVLEVRRPMMADGQERKPGDLVDTSAWPPRIVRAMLNLGRLRVPEHQCQALEPTPTPDTDVASVTPTGEGARRARATPRVAAPEGENNG